MRGGVAPSRVYLPQGPWSRLYDFLVQRFPHITADVIRARMLRGEIVDQDGIVQAPDTPYRPLKWLWYYREVPGEIPVPFELPVLFQDRHLVVVDKPHFLASTPGGRYLTDTALTRLRLSLDLPLLSPIHRLDRDTAGVMLFCADPDSRGAYQNLFQAREVHKEYMAVAPINPDLKLPCVHHSRLQARADHFTMQEVPGEPNSETSIELVTELATEPCHAINGIPQALALYRLRPRTGRKHQLRAHMSALGIPICNDGLYPQLQPFPDEHDFTRPLQLLASSIAFTDPLSGLMRRFESQRRLEWARV